MHRLSRAYSQGTFISVYIIMFVFTDSYMCMIVCVCMHAYVGVSVSLFWHCVICVECVSLTYKHCLSFLLLWENKTDHEEILSYLKKCEEGHLAIEGLPCQIPSHPCKHEKSDIKITMMMMLMLQKENLAYVNFYLKENEGNEWIPT